MRVFGSQCFDHLISETSVSASYEIHLARLVRNFGKIYRSGSLPDCCHAVDAMGRLHGMTEQLVGGNAALALRNVAQVITPACIYSHMVGHACMPCAACDLYAELMT